MSFIPRIGDAAVGVERAVLVHVDFGRDGADVEELKALVKSAGAECVGVVTGKRKAPDASLYIGKGKLEEVRLALTAAEAGLVVFNHTLTPSQERNLEKSLSCKVIDRNRLILDIFSQRARSFEGKLQVELAQLQYLSSRLVRGWTHLERQRGGIGLRGPGETQLETDRRLVADRIRQIKKRLEKVHQQREVGSRSRRRAEMPLVSIVGYTNAGKSTLFNRMTEAAVYCADQLFATLDTTSRRLELAPGREIVLVDTVGFVRALPHDLVAAFRATLTETREADLLLHIVDASDPAREATEEAVNTVLKDIGADDRPQLLVYNKNDLCDQPERIEWDEQGLPRAVWVSARTGAGLSLLVEAMAQRLGPDRVRGSVRLAPAAARLRAKLFAMGAVRSERIGEDGSFDLQLELPRRRLDQLTHEEPALAAFQER